MIAIVAKLSQALKVAPYQGNQASKCYFTLSLDDQTPMSQSRITTLQPYYGFQWEYLDPILLKKPETLYLSLVRYLKTRIRLLGQNN